MRGQITYYDHDAEGYDKKACNSLLGCSYLFAYHGLSEAGNIKVHDGISVAQTTSFGRAGLVPGVV